MPTDDPAVQRRRLRVELKKARLDAEKTQRDVADAMDWSVSKVIRIEGGDVKISKNDLRALLDFYQVRDQRTVDTLIDAARAAREDSWPDFRDVHSPAFLTYLGYESSAWLIRNYEPLVIPGLLQTEEYAFAVQTEVNGESEEVAERRWDARLQRFKLHDRDKPPKMLFILDEAAIRRPIGGLGVMRQQLKRLREMADEPHVSLQVVPFHVGGYLEMGLPFILLEFQDPNDEDILFLEHAATRTTRDDPEETGPYLTRFLELEKVALSAEDTKALLDQVMDEMEGNPAPAAESSAEDAAMPKETKGRRRMTRTE